MTTRGNLFLSSCLLALFAVQPSLAIGFGFGDAPSSEPVPSHIPAPTSEPDVSTPTTVLAPTSEPVTPTATPSPGTRGGGTDEPGLEILHECGEYWVTTDGSPVDESCILGEMYGAAVSDVYIIGTHGAEGGGWAQCLPLPGEIDTEGCPATVCSICYAAEEGPNGVSINDEIEDILDVPCTDIIACTGTVTPVGPHPVLDCAQFVCDGTWVDACEPPNVIGQDHVDNLCLDTTTPIPVNTPTSPPLDMGGDDGERRFLREN